MGPELLVVGAFLAIVVAGVAAIGIQSARAGARTSDVDALIRELKLFRSERVDNDERILAEGKVDGVDVQLRSALGLALLARVNARIEVHGTPALPGTGIGDPTFDAAVAVHGPEGVALSILHPRSREAVRALVYDSAGLIGDGWARRFAEGDRDSLFDAVKRVVAVAKAFDERPASAATLLRNFREEISPEYRARVFHHLLREDPASPELTEAARLLVLDERLGPVARLLTGDGTAMDPPAGIAEAIHRLPVASRPPLLRRLASAGTAAEPILLELLARAEGPLRAEDPEGAHDAAALAAILSAFGGGGTVASVERLKAHASGVLTPSDVKLAAQEAIAVIQSGAVGGAGALALSDSGTDGAVSMTGDAGRVSLTDGKKP